MIAISVGLVLLIAKINEGPVCQVAQIKSQDSPINTIKEAEQAHKVGMMFTHDGLTGALILALDLQNNIQKQGKSSESQHEEQQSKGK